MAPINFVNTSPRALCSSKWFKFILRVSCYLVLCFSIFLVAFNHLHYIHNIKSSKCTDNRYLHILSISEQMNTALQGLSEMYLMARQHGLMMVEPGRYKARIGDYDDQLMLGDVYDLKVLKDRMVAKHQWEQCRSSGDNEGMKEVYVEFVHDPNTITAKTEITDISRNNTTRCSTSELKVPHPHLSFQTNTIRRRCIHFSKPLQMDFTQLTTLIPELIDKSYRVVHIEAYPQQTLSHKYLSKVVQQQQQQLHDTRKTEDHPWNSLVTKFSSTFTQYGNAIIQKLMNNEPYIAFHIRVEKMHPDAVEKCGTKILQSLKNKMRQLGVRKLFIASDVFESTSDTFALRQNVTNGDVKLQMKDPVRAYFHTLLDKTLSNILKNVDIITTDMVQSQMNQLLSHSPTHTTNPSSLLKQPSNTLLYYSAMDQWICVHAKQFLRGDKINMCNSRTSMFAVAVDKMRLIRKAGNVGGRTREESDFDT